MKPKQPYFLYFIILLLIELSIALFVKHSFIRGWLGDFLAVLLLYVFLRSFWNHSPRFTGMLVLFTAYWIECLQYFKLLNYLGLHEHPIISTILGTTFSIEDLIAYTLGVLFAFIVDQKLIR